MSAQANGCAACLAGEHADDGTGGPCPCCDEQVPAIVHLAAWSSATTLTECGTDDLDALTTGNPDDVTCSLCAELAGIDLEEVDQ